MSVKTSCNISETSHFLTIIKQQSLESETFTENGVKKSVHYVVKNTGFEFIIGLEPVDLTQKTESLDFSQVALRASLMYDCKDDKEVSCVKINPLTYRGVPSTSSTCRLDAMIKVLSSQHEDMNFCIKFEPVCATSKLPLAGVSAVFSEPIHVISKPGVLKNLHKASEKGPSTRNKTKAQQTLDAVSRIELQLQQQRSLLDQVLANSQLGKRQRRDDTDRDPFTDACYQLLQEFQKLPQDERPNKLRRVLDESEELKQLFSSAAGVPANHSPVICNFDQTYPLLYEPSVDGFFNDDPTDETLVELLDLPVGTLSL